MDNWRAALFPAMVVSLGDVHSGFVVQSVASIPIAGRCQRFYPSLVDSYHGLSLMGMDMLAYDVPKKPKPVVAAAAPALPSPSPPPIVPHNSAALALTRAAQSRKTGGNRL